MAFALEAARHINLLAILYFSVGSAKEISHTSKLSPPVINFQHVSVLPSYTPNVRPTQLILLGPCCKYITAVIYLPLSHSLGGGGRGVKSVGVGGNGGAGGGYCSQFIPQ